MNAGFSNKSRFFAHKANVFWVREVRIKKSLVRGKGRFINIDVHCTGILQFTIVEMFKLNTYIRTPL